MQDSVKSQAQINWKAIFWLIFIIALGITSFIYAKEYWQNHTGEKTAVPLQAFAQDQAIIALQEKINKVQQDLQDSIAGKSETAPQAANIAEIKDAYFLTRIAADRLQFGDVATAKQLLQLAQERLATAHNPKVANVRTLLKADLAKLAEVNLPSVSLIQEKLTAANDIFNTLPPKGYNDTIIKVQQTNPQNKQKVNPDAKWQQKIDVVMADLKNVVKVRKKVAGEDPLTYVNEEMDRAEFKLLIEQARWSVFYRDPIAYQRSLQAAQNLLARDFDLQNEQVKTVAATLNELASMKIAPNVPNIQDSINALQALLIG